MKSFFQNKTGSGFDTVSVRANIRMCVTRLSMQQNKLVNSVKMQRRRIAELLAIGKNDSARIQVENCVRQDVSIEGLEVLSLFLDLLANRIQLISECKPLKTDSGKKDPLSVCPPELKEAVTSVLWASARVGETAPELAAVRKAFEKKFGRTFVEMSISNAECSVNQKLLERLGMYTPSNEKCIAYLTSIAKEFQLENYDEDNLKDPNGLAASAGVAGAAALKESMLGAAGTASLSCASGAIQTPSGLYIPAVVQPRDAVDSRLLRLRKL